MQGTMGLSGRLKSVLGWMSGGFRVDLAMDLGTANTLVYVKGEGIVVNEPSLVAIDTRTNRMVALGREAEQLVERPPDHVRVIRPLKDGVIADFDTAMAMIKGFLKKTFPLSLWVTPRIVMGIPSGITKVEKRAVRESAQEAGAGHIHLVEETMAAAMGAGIDVEAPQASMVVDIGGGTTEVAIISTCSVAHFESIRIAGDAMDEAIVRYLRRAMHLEITRRLGEEIKIRIGCAIPPSEVQRVTLKAKEAGRGGLRTVELTSVHTSEALEKPVDAIIDCVRRVLEDAPPALLSDALEGGMVLTGGGSLLPGFEELMSRMLGIRVSKADDPMASVVRGCGMAIEDPQRWQRIFVT